MKQLLASLLFLLLCPAAAFGGDAPAPRHVRILAYGVDDIANCAAPLQALQAELPSLAFPDGWTIGVVCTPLAWDALLQIADAPPTRSAFSNFIRHSTVVNAAIFHQVRSSYRHTLAHELAHVTCNCADEHMAEQLARKLERTPTRAQLPHVTTGIVEIHSSSAPRTQK